MKKVFKRLNITVTQRLQEMLTEINPYVMVFRTARDMFDKIQQKNLCIRNLEAKTGNRRQYKLSYM